MSTVIAHSPRGAVKLWMAKRPKASGYVSVKARGGSDDWQDFKIS